MLFSAPASLSAEIKPKKKSQKKHKKSENTVPSTKTVYAWVCRKKSEKMRINEKIETHLTLNTRVGKNWKKLKKLLDTKRKKPT